MALGTGDGCQLEAIQEVFQEAQLLLIFHLRDDSSGDNDKDSDENGTDSSIVQTKSRFIFSTCTKQDDEYDIV